jgi:hypothetical protein
MQDREQREAAKEKLIEAFRTARKVMCGSTLVIGTPAEVEVEVKKALRRGESVTENGVSRWISHQVVFKSGKSGSDAYVWDKTGNKVKHEKVLCTKTQDGRITTETIGFCFLEWNV